MAEIGCQTSIKVDEITIVENYTIKALEQSTIKEAPQQLYSDDRLFNSLQNSLQIVTAVDLPTAKTFAILLNEFPVGSLQIAMATRFSTAKTNASQITSN